MLQETIEDQQPPKVETPVVDRYDHSYPFKRHINFDNYSDYQKSDFSNTVTQHDPLPYKKTVDNFDFENPKLEAYTQNENIN